MKQSGRSDRKYSRKIKIGCPRHNIKFMAKTWIHTTNCGDSKLHDGHWSSQKNSQHKGKVLRQWCRQCRSQPKPRSQLNDRGDEAWNHLLKTSTLRIQCHNSWILSHQKESTFKLKKMGRFSVCVLSTVWRHYKQSRKGTSYCACRTCRCFSLPSVLQRWCLPQILCASQAYVLE